MVPPPSQAGKFKPRKPPKKIKAGAATAASTSSAAAEPAASAPSTSGRASGRGRGRGRGSARGGGRGAGRGGGGRGRKRSPIALPRGAVYFTGNQTTPGGAAGASAKSSSGGGGGTRSGAVKVGSSRQTKTKGSKAIVQGEKESDEVVVGELDVAIGSTAPGAPKPTKLSSTKQDEDLDMDFDPLASKNIVSAVETYDSDSSYEEQRSRKKLGGSSSLPPTQLPFPIAKVPVGIGEGHDNSRAMYSCQLDQTQQRQGEQVETAEQQQHDPPPVSPFCNVNVQDRKAEQDSWFLMQFPTRLPPLAHSTTAAAATAGPDVVTSNEDGQAMAVDPILSASASVAPTTSATVLNAFDDSFKGASAGKLGKILVYKSGKTVLVMGGDGSPEIRMNVTEGLSCGFVQQAVAIDTDQGTYVPLGDVKKTIVVTPDVERAFPSS